MDEYTKPFSYRVGAAFNFAEKSDFYSANGKTWDQNADTPYFYGTSSEYRQTLLAEAQKTEISAKSLDDLSKELVDFILRVEARIALKSKQPISRAYPTNIPYSFEDPETGKRVKKYLDLKTASNYELESLVGQIPEALYELLYRSVTGKNNTTE